MDDYEAARLNDVEVGFFDAERGSVYGHIGTTIVLDRAPFGRRADGTIELAELFAAHSRLLDLVPRYAQTIERVPVWGTPVWVESPRVDLADHVRVIHAQAPGGEADLRKVVEQLESRCLRRGRPLWETWIVDGLADGRVAFVHKAHHSMVDGTSMIFALQTLLAPSSAGSSAGSSAAHGPGHAALGLQVVDTVAQRNTAFDDETRYQLARVRKGIDASIKLAGSTTEERAAFARRVTAAAASVARGFPPVLGLPLNSTIGPKRNLEWYDIPIDVVHRLRSAFGGTVNDVALALYSAAIREFLLDWKGRVGAPAVRIAVPVNARGRDSRARFGNHVCGWIVDAPLAWSAPAERVAHIKAQTSSLKQATVVAGPETLGVLTGKVLRAVAKLGEVPAPFLPFHTALTNVPGPAERIRFGGATVERVLPHMIIAQHIAFNTAVTTYDGRMQWAFTSDPDRIPPERRFGDSLDRVIAEFEAAAADLEPHEPVSGKERDATKPVRRPRVAQRDEA